MLVAFSLTLVTCCLTVTLHVAESEPTLAVITAEPAFLAVTTPLSTDAIVAFDDDHSTSLVAVARSGVTVAFRVNLEPV